MPLDAIGIVSRDLKKSVKFYGALGMEFQETGGGSDHLEGHAPSGLRLMLDSVELIQSINPSWKPQAGTGMSLCFLQESSEKVDSTYKKLIEIGSKSVKEPWDAFWGQRYACVQDPDGNQIDLFASL